jgi:predicted ATPase
VETILHGWALVIQGRQEDGIAQMRQGLAACQVIGAEIIRPYWLALLAEAYGKIGQAEKGLSLLTEGLALVDKTEERSHEAELYRLKGELFLKSRQVEDKSKASQDKSEVWSPESPTPSPHAEAEAEACFWKAIGIAQRQSAKSFELRAVISLAWLWQRQDKKEEARQLLAEIYSWFAEGFDTADLKEAKALLEELTEG